MQRFFLITIFLFLLSPVFVFAAESGFVNNPESGFLNEPESGTVNCPQGSTCLDNPLKEDSIEGVFKTVMDAIFIIFLPFFVLWMGFVGLMFVVARGNPEKLAKAKNAFLYAIIGTGIFFGAWVLINMLASLMRALGVPI